MSSEIHWNKDTDIETLLIQDYDPHEDHYPSNEIEYHTLKEISDGNGEDPQGNLEDDPKFWINILKLMSENGPKTELDALGKVKVRSLFLRWIISVFLSFSISNFVSDDYLSSKKIFTWHIPNPSY